MVLTASLFNQLLQHFPRTEFAALVKVTKAERHSRGFTCWTQFVAMLFCHLAQADSLRIICNGLHCCLGKLTHLGISERPTSPVWPTPISVGRLCCLSSCSGKRWIDFDISRCLVGVRNRFVSKTSCCRWTRPPFRCVFLCFPGLNSKK